MSSFPGAWLVINEPVVGLTDQSGRLDVGNGTLSFNSMLRKRGTASVPLFVAANDLSGPPVTAQVNCATGDSVVPLAGYALTGIQVGSTVTINGVGGYTVTSCGTSLTVTPSPGIQSNVTLVSGPTQYNPTVGSPLYLYDVTPTNSIQVFAGTIDDTTVASIDDAGNTHIIVTAVSLESVFDTVIVPSRIYTNVSCGYIFQDLLGLVPGAPVTAGEIDSGKVLAQFVVSNYPKISDLFDQLATASLFVWGIDPSSSEVYFHLPSAVPAPFEVQTSDLQFASFNLKAERKDYRNRQIIQTSYDAFAHSSELFANSDTQNLTQGQFSYALLRPVQQVTNAWYTFNTQSTANGTFTGQPNPGDTITITFPQSGSAYNWSPSVCPSTPSNWSLGQIIIDSNGHVQKCTVAGTSKQYADSPVGEPAWSTDGGFVTDGPPAGGCSFTSGVTWTDQGAQGFANNYEALYVFVSVLDNTQWGQVLIGATLAETIQNFVDALNNVDAVLVNTSGDTVTAVGLEHTLAFVLNGAEILINGTPCTVTSTGTTLQVSPAPGTLHRVILQTSAQPTYGQGKTFSFPTWENPLVNGDDYEGTDTITVRNKAAGAGYIAALGTGTTTGGVFTPGGIASFSWAAPSTSGGVTKPNTSVCPVGVYGTLSTPGLAYQPGSNIVSLSLAVGLPPNVGLTLQVEYTRADGDSITVENTAQVAYRASIEHGTGMYQQRMTADASWTNVQALAQVQQVLAAYCVIPQTFLFDTLRAGLLASYLVTVLMATPSGFASLVNGQWCVQEVNARWIPKKPYIDPDVAGIGVGHFQYTLRVIDVAQIGDFVDFWEGLAGQGSGGSASVIGSGGSLTSLSSGDAALDQIGITTTPYNILEVDAVFTLGSGASVVNLPATASVVRGIIYIVNKSGGAVTLNPASGDTINGLSSLSLPNGSSWQYVPNS